MTRRSLSPWPVALALLQAAGAATAANAPAGPRSDLLGDSLPAEAVARMGSGRLRHDGMLDFAFAPDGKSLASVSRRDLRVWEVATGKLRRRIPVEGEQCAAVRFTAQGIVVAAAPKEPKAATVQLLDPSSGKVLRRTEVPALATSVYGLTLSPDGKRLAAHADEGLRLVCDAVTGRQIVGIPAAPDTRTRDLAFSPDGNSLAVAENGGAVRLYDIGSGKQLRAFPCGDKALGARFSPDGRWLVALAANDKGLRPGACSIWDVTTGERRRGPQFPPAPVWSAQFSPDGKYLATVSEYGDPVLWDLATGKEARRFPTAGLFGHTAFSPDGKTLAAVFGWGSTIRLWDVATGRVLPGSADPALDRVQDLRFSADGRRLFGSDAVPVAWDALTGREVRRYAAPPPSSFFCRLSPDETLVASGGRGGKIRLSDARTGKEVRVLKGHETEVWGVTFLPGGRLGSWGNDSAGRVWDVASGRELYQPTSGARWVQFAASPDDRLLATATSAAGPRDEYEVVLRDLATGRPEKRLPLGGEHYACQVAFAPDGRRLAVAVSDAWPTAPRAIQVWDLAGGRKIRSLEAPQLSVVSMTISPDGRSLATGGSRGSLYLWELASGRRRHAFAGHEGEVVSVAFSPDGRLLAASSSDAPVYTWDVTGAFAPSRPAPTAAELGRCWDELAGADAEAAFRAIRRLAGSPGAAVPFLRERLKPVAAVPPERLRRLLADLDGDDFAARRRAAAELEALADIAAPELRKALGGVASAEVRRALQKALDGLDSPTPERLRAVRAVEALEWAGTPGAARLLDELARGAQGATLTAEAAAARDRLRKAEARGEAAR
jgi:WD40 repeat protein